MVAPYLAVGGAAVAYAGYKYLKKGSEPSKGDQERDKNIQSSEEISTEFEKEDADSSLEAHNDALDREPPVEVGERYQVMLEEEISTSKNPRKFKSRYEGFLIFVSVHTDDIGVDNVVTIKITSISNEENAAQAKYVPNV